MKISPDQVAKIANLARLELDEQTSELFAGQLGDVLSYMDKLNELDTEGVDPLYGPMEHDTPLRADVPAKDIAREEILANAPETDGQFFIVPKIV